MALKILRNRPNFSRGNIRIKSVPVLVGGGGVQDINQNINTTSMPAIQNWGTQVNPWTQDELQNIYMPIDAIIEDEDGVQVNPFSQTSDPFMGYGDAGYQGYLVDNREDARKVADQSIGYVSDSVVSDIDSTEQKRSQDGNPLDPMTLPYYAPDLQGRAQMLGSSLGRIRAGNKTGMNVAKAALSGVSLGLGLTREIMGASSSAYAASRDEQAARERLAKERRQQFIRYEREGGGVNLGNGERFDTGDLTGEYIYPLPKSMQDNANVEIEKGEYAILPDVVGPMEAKGNKHEKGGTPVDLPEAHIVSDYRKITDEFASYVRENYGIKATSKDSYATLLDRYKKKIGLSEKYEDQEKVYNRLKKNQDVKDKGTSDLNKSILSKYVNENQEEIDSLEERFRSFADIVYKSQEESKRGEKMDAFFKEGGAIDEKTIEKQAKTYNVSKDKIKNWIYDEYVKQSRKMAEGGPTKEQIDRARELQKLLMQQFGRRLNMSVVDVAGREQILNPDSNVNANQNLQGTSRFGYGRVNERALSNLLDVNRWGNRFRTDNEFDTEGFQTEYNKQLNNLWALADVGAISNADAAKSFRDQYGFWGEDAGRYDQGNRSAYNSFGVDDKFGQTTATRSFYGLDVVTPEQKRLLNEKGIRNYVDLFGDKSSDAKNILGSDYDKFVAIRDSGLNPDLDFVIEQAAPEAGELVVEDPELPDADDVLKSNPILRPAASDNSSSSASGNQARGQAGGARFNPIFPEVLRPVNSGIIVEGMERHQAPRVDPVLQSADQYINELNRATSSQLDAIGDVPDSQRAAILANMNAIAGSNIAKYINEVNLNNARQINEANRFNEIAYTQTDDKNIAERQRYEAGVLKAMAINDENIARYYDSINSEIQNKFNVQTSLNTIASIAPNMRMLPNGQIVYTQGNEDVLNVGDWSTPYLRSMNEEDETKRKRGGR